MNNDDVFMSRALRLAMLGRHASPNPMVGCVIVSPEGRIVGEGFHAQAGMPHAEVYALRAAGNQARGATAYVTLEPCAHYGRTPPCADALLAAGIARVVVAVRDPNPVAAGGLERVQASGVETTIGVGETRARALNAPFLKLRTTGLPWVVLKTAMTLDGKIATATGDSQWITSAISRRAVHRQLRDRCDAILTGIGTVLADDPALTTRLTHKIGRDPWRIVVDSRGRMPLDSQVVRRAALDGKTIIATTFTADFAALDALRAAGCHVLICESAISGRVNLRDLMHRLGTRNDILSVLAECGGELAAGLLNADLVDRWLCFLAPKAVGGRTAPGPIGGTGIARMADARAVTHWRTRCSGPDLIIDAGFG
jgi:diaminohydroxyphosphoribosylaminopyrimidine deaminase/5-amino-6-(5-phosphoribosylamino)uracil reductase